MPLHIFKHKRKQGLADETGRVHVAPLYDRLSLASEGLHLFQRDFKRGFMDDTGAIVIPNSLKWANPFVHGWAVAAETGGIYGLLDASGAWGLAADYGGLALVSENLVAARRTGEEIWGLLEIATGAWRIEPTWKEVRSGNGRLVVKLGRKFGAIDAEGLELIPGKRWSLLQSNDDDTWIGQEKKKGPFHLLTATGEVVHTFEDGVEVRPFHGDVAPACKNKLWGLLDRTGNWVMDPLSSQWLDPTRDPIVVRVGKKYGYARPGDNLVIPASFTDAQPFIAGFAAVDCQIIDVSGRVVATIDPAEAPVHVAPPPPPKSASGKALVKMLRGRGTPKTDPAVVAAIAALPDGDIAAVLHTWYVSGMPWISLGPWEVWTTTYGTALEHALKTKQKVLPFGHGEYNDPINIRFPRGRLKLSVDSNPDDTAPRHFPSLQAFTDQMVLDALYAMEDDVKSPNWPLPESIATFCGAGGLGAGARSHLETMVRGVAHGDGEHAEAAAAWIAEHGTPEPEPPAASSISLQFEVCDAPVTAPTPPPHVSALLEAGGHLRYMQGSTGRWLSLTNKGIRFANAKGKRKVGAVGLAGKHGPAVVLVDDDTTALVAGKSEAIRVNLDTAKKEKLFQRPYGEVDHMTPTPDGAGILACLRGEDYTATTLRLYDLTGAPQKDIPIPPLKFVDGLIALWDGLVALPHFDGVVVVDVRGGVVARHAVRPVKDGLGVSGRRLTLSQWDGKHVELVG